MNVNELLAKVIEMSGIDPLSVPTGKAFGWFDKAFKLGDTHPFNKRTGIVAMFQNETEVRVYAVPIEKPVKDEEVFFTRHTLTKSAPTFFFEVLPPDVFQAEIADELAVLAGETANSDDFSEEEEEEEEEQPQAAAPPAEETTAPAT